MSEDSEFVGNCSTCLQAVMLNEMNLNCFLNSCFLIVGKETCFGLKGLICANLQEFFDFYNHNESSSSMELIAFK